MLHLLCAFNETDRLIDAIRLLIDEGGLSVHTTAMNDRFTFSLAV